MEERTEANVTKRAIKIMGNIIKLRHNTIQQLLILNVVFIFFTLIALPNQFIVLLLFSISIIVCFITQKFLRDDHVLWYSKMLDHNNLKVEYEQSRLSSIFYSLSYALFIAGLLIFVSAMSNSPIFF